MDRPGTKHVSSQTVGFPRQEPIERYGQPRADQAWQSVRNRLASLRCEKTPAATNREPKISRASVSARPVSAEPAREAWPAGLAASGPPPRRTGLAGHVALSRHGNPGRSYWPVRPGRRGWPGHPQTRFWNPEPVEGNLDAYFRSF